jgi:hypothetical protein
LTIPNSGKLYCHTSPYITVMHIANATFWSYNLYAITSSLIRHIFWSSHVQTAFSMCRNIKHTFRNITITEDINFYKKVNPNRKLSGHFEEEYKLWMMHEARRKSPDIINNWSICGCTTVQSTNDQKSSLRYWE